MSARNSFEKDKNIGCSRFCVELAILWRRYAHEMRFMQFISNFQSWIGDEAEAFYMEDYDALQKLEDFCKKTLENRGDY